jgi:hypothetical protein
MVLGLVQLLARPLLQTYLNSSLIRWHRAQTHAPSRWATQRRLPGIFPSIMNNTSYMIPRRAASPAPRSSTSCWASFCVTVLLTGRVMPELEGRDLTGPLWRHDASAGAGVGDCRWIS